MTKEYSEGMATNWDPATAFSAWEEIKLLYSDLDREDDQGTEDIGSSQNSPRGTQGDVAGLEDGGEGVVAEDVVE